MAIYKNCLLDSIDDDTNLVRREKLFLKLIVGFWGSKGYHNLDKMIQEKYLNPDQTWLSTSFTQIASHRVLYKKLNYKYKIGADGKPRPSGIVSVIIRSLCEKCYIKKYDPGTGIEGQEQNVSQFSKFEVRFPTSYALPVIKTPEKSQLIAIAINTLKVHAGLNSGELQLQVAKKDLEKQTLLTDSKKGIKSYKENYKKARRVSALQVSIDKGSR